MEWLSLVNQPRNLTEQSTCLLSYAQNYDTHLGAQSVWKRILPKLQILISKEPERRMRLRRLQYVAEADTALGSYLKELPPTIGHTLTTYQKLRGSEELRKMIERGDIDIQITRELFDVVVPAVITGQSSENHVLYLDALRCALHPELPVSDAKLQPNPHPDSVIALFPCLHCADYRVTKRNYSLNELSQHVKERHLLTHESSGDRPPEESLAPKHFQIDIVRQVLKMLGISEDTRYQDISGKVVCLCGKPDFEQPAQFSALVRFNRVFDSSPPVGLHTSFSRYTMSQKSAIGIPQNSNVAREGG